MVDLEVQRKSLPHNPGVYLFKDKNGNILYVGKAIDLNKRVSQYFQKSTYRDPYFGEKIKDLVSHIVDIDYIITENEKEAFILENIQIKKHLPKYNVRFRDDTTYPFLMITYSENYPRIRVIRGPHKYNQKNLFIGPYTDKKELRRILRFIRKTIPFCTCKRKVKENQKKACMYYQIKLCPGPCIGKITPEDYLQNIKQVELFLKGETDKLTKILKNKMEKAVEEQNFESAAIWRDRLGDLTRVTIKHTIISGNKKNQDIISYYKDEEFSTVLILLIREGKISGKIPFIYDLKGKLIERNGIIPAFMKQYYLHPATKVPNEIIVSEIHEDVKVLKDLLSEKLKKNIIVKTPSDHFEEGFLKIANKNAKVIVEQEKIKQELELESPNQINQALNELKEVLNLPNIPHIIEGFDISNIQGTDPTGSLVSFLDGKPNKKWYRHYKILSKSTPDDVGMMKEVVYRRYNSLIEKNLELPDLILIDGGKGQLNATLSVLNDLGIGNTPILGLAKKFEEIYLPNKKEPIRLSDDSAALKLLQRVRDEAHRFGVKLHRKLREKRVSKSILDDIPGIGPAKRTKLLETFGSVDGIKRAKLEDISEVVGEKLAIIIQDFLSNNN